MRTAKYCKIFKPLKEPCNQCGEEFDTIQQLQTHTVDCKNSKNNNTNENDQCDQQTILQQIQQLIQPLVNQPQPIQPKSNDIENLVTRKDLDELRNLIVNMKPNTTVPPVVQNMDPVTVAHIEAMALEHLDISDIEEGIDGIVDFTITYPLQGRVICTDKARRKFRYTDENGNIVNDYGGVKLSQTVFEGIQSRCVQLIDQKYAELTNDIKIAVDNNRGYEDAVLASMQQGTELQNLKKSLMDAARGVENDLQKGYIRKLVKEL